MTPWPETTTATKQSRSFRDDEPVFQSHYVTPGVPVPMFGATSEWPPDAVPRPVNVLPGMHVLRIAVDDPTWNLRIREVLMADANPSHPALRRNGLFRVAEPSAVSTLRKRLGKLRWIADWALAHHLPQILADWTTTDVERCLAEAARGGSPSATHQVVLALRVLHQYGPILTDGGLTFFPWPGRSAAEVSGRSALTADGIRTPAISPEVYWPLLRAAWTYVDLFSRDILEARQARLAFDERKSRRERRLGAFSDDRAVLMALERHFAAASATVPLQSGEGRSAPSRHVRGQINWSAVDDVVFGGARVLSEGELTRTDRFRPFVEGLVAQGRGRIGWFRIQPAPVERADGTNGPWHDDFDSSSALHEEYMLRNACFIFGMAMSAMRDGEWQSVKKGSITEYFGAPAIRTTLTKGTRNVGQAGHWWITEPVVKALQIAERLSWHEEYVWVTGSPKGGARTRVGVSSRQLIDGFIQHVNASCAETGLNPVPEERVRPHMFRRTFAIIAACEPGAEIALGLLFKHASRRAAANAVTAGYYSEDPGWVKELVDEQANAAADRLFELAIRRRSGEVVAAGPGAARLHERLDDLLEGAGDDDGPRANVVDDETLRRVLKSEFVDLHLGNLNHCMYREETAECVKLVKHNAQPGPLIDMCRPSTCRNSVVTDVQRPMWELEEQQLTTQRLGRLPAPRRALIDRRLNEVRAVLDSIGVTHGVDDGGR